MLMVKMVFKMIETLVPPRTHHETSDWIIQPQSSNVSPLKMLSALMEISSGNLHRLLAQAQSFLLQ